MVGTARESCLYRTSFQLRNSVLELSNVTPWPWILLRPQTQVRVLAAFSDMSGRLERVPSDISSIDHLVMREFMSGSPRYHLAIKGVREQFVVLEQSSGPLKFRLRLHLFLEVQLKGFFFGSIISWATRGVVEKVRVYRCWE